MHDFYRALIRTCAAKHGAAGYRQLARRHAILAPLYVLLAPVCCMADSALFLVPFVAVLALFSVVQTKVARDTLRTLHAEETHWNQERA